MKNVLIVDDDLGFQRLLGISLKKYKKDFFNEVVVDLKNIDIDQFMNKLKAKGILPGIPLNWFFKKFKNHILVNFTEMHRKADIDNFVNAIGELK